jgi:hypothetical protein
MLKFIRIYNFIFLTKFFLSFKKQIFQKFKSLIQLNSCNNYSILLNNMKTLLNDILINQNSKEFEPYLVILKDMLHLKLIDSNEFFQFILKPLLKINSKSIQNIIHCLNVRCLNETFFVKQEFFSIYFDFLRYSTKFIQKTIRIIVFQLLLF